MDRSRTVPGARAPVPSRDRLRDRAGLAILVDPASTSPDDAERVARGAVAAGVGALLVGGSDGTAEQAGTVARALRRRSAGLPIVQFPAHAGQLIGDVDAVLFLVLVSGRNPQYLIEEQVRAVPFFTAHPHVAAIATAYCLIDGGAVTTVEVVSQTRPLPATKPELVFAHVRAAMLIGMQAVYLDAGSGAPAPVSAAVIRAARSATDGLLFVGGGIRSPDQVRAARCAGADYVVVGNAVEAAGGIERVYDLAMAARP